MDIGYVLELSHHNSRHQPTWVQGRPERSFWSGLKIKDKKQIPILTFRCAQCGLLLDYAV